MWMGPDHRRRSLSTYSHQLEIWLRDMRNEQNKTCSNLCNIRIQKWVRQEEYQWVSRYPLGRNRTSPWRDTCWKTIRWYTDGEEIQEITCYFREDIGFSKEKLDTLKVTRLEIFGNRAITSKDVRIDLGGEGGNILNALDQWDRINNVKGLLDSILNLSHWFKYLARKYEKKRKKIFLGTWTSQKWAFNDDSDERGRA